LNQSFTSRLSHFSGYSGKWIFRGIFHPGMDRSAMLDSGRPDDTVALSPAMALKTVDFRPFRRFLLGLAALGLS